MKKHLFAAAFIALSTISFAERPSSDEVAIRLGVRAWFAGHSSSGGQFDVAKLQPLYSPALEFTEPKAGKDLVGRGFDAYAARLLPLTQDLQKLEAKPGDDMRVALQGSTAVTDFAFRPQGTYKDGRAVTCAARVSLTWERHNGFWQIVREDLAPLDPKPAELVTAK